MYIYKITNKINNKIYIGQTVTTIEKRFKRHLYKYSKNSKYKTVLFSAMEKYGRVNFTIEEIDTAQDIEELNEKEIYWIKQLNSLSPNGYNLTTGGNNKGHLSDDMKRKISESNKGKKISEDTRQKLRESHLGFKVSEETKEKLRKSNKGKKPHINTLQAVVKKLSKTYYFISPEGVEVTIVNMASFCRDNNLQASKMCLVNKGTVKQHKGWKLNKVKKLIMTKEEKIKEAWGDYFKYLTDKTVKSVLINHGVIDYFMLTVKERDETENNVGDIRKLHCVGTDEGTPRKFTIESLKGIENNNSWYKTEEGLPKVSGMYICYHKQGYQSQRYFNIEFEEFYEYDSETLNQSDVTHYRPVEIIPDPLY